jgi:hypothetical protein
VVLSVTAKSGFRGNRQAWFLRILMVVLVAGVGRWVTAQEISESEELAVLPDAPQAQGSPKTTDAPPAGSQKKCPPVKQAGQGPEGTAGAGEPSKNTAAGCHQKFDFSYPLGKPPGHGQPLTSTDKLRIAASDVVDPFNLLTIAATAAISVGSDPNSGYGPGLKGWAKNSATLLTEDMTGAFFVTYAIPSLTHQDPRYYRMPNASIPRRIENVIVQPVWARSDKGGHMPNYGMLLGVPASVALADIYVPGRKQGFWPIVSTSAIAIASAPIDNVVDEFLPDVSKHVSVHIVLIQRIVNHLTLTEGSS